MSIVFEEGSLTFPLTKTVYSYTVPASRTLTLKKLLWRLQVTNSLFAITWGHVFYPFVDSTDKKGMESFFPISGVRAWGVFGGDGGSGSGYYRGGNPYKQGAASGFSLTNDIDGGTYDFAAGTVIGVKMQYLPQVSSDVYPVYQSYGNMYEIMTTLWGVLDDGTRIWDEKITYWKYPEVFYTYTVPSGKKLKLKNIIYGYRQEPRTSPITTSIGEVLVLIDGQILRGFNEQYMGMWQVWGPSGGLNAIPSRGRQEKSVGAKTITFNDQMTLYEGQTLSFGWGFTGVLDIATVKTKDGVLYQPDILKMSFIGDLTDMSAKPIIDGSHIIQAVA